MSFIVTIDGPAASGKSSVAQLLAEKFDLKQLDSGAFYRAVTVLALQQQERSNMVLNLLVDSLAFKKYLLESRFEINFFSGQQQLLVNGINFDNLICSPAVTDNIKYIADNIFIRLFINKQLKTFAKSNDIVINGRDMGTIVFPYADLRFFLEADISVRSQRRYQELSLNNKNITYEFVLESMQERDKNDYAREYGRLEKSSDLIVIDATNRSLEDVVLLMSARISKLRNGCLS